MEAPKPDWRRARDEQAHERYKWLRQQIHAGAQVYRPEHKLREEARQYANESCRLAIALQSRG